MKFPVKEGLVARHHDCKGLGRGRCMHHYPHEGGGGRGPIGITDSGGGRSGCMVVIAAIGGIASMLSVLVVWFI